MNTNTWRPEDGQLLQSLRVKAGINAHVFARNNTLSHAQLQELETGVGNSFYNAPIKRSAGVKLLKKLGHEFKAPIILEPEAIFEGLTSQANASQALPQVSSTPSSTTSTSSPLSNSRWGRTMIWMGGLLSMGLVGLLSIQGLKSPPAERIQSGTHQIEHASSNGPASTPQLTEPPPTLRVASSAETLPNSPHITPIQVPASASTDRTPFTSVTCEDTHRKNSRSHTPIDPLKPGNYIYIEARADTELCVLDSENKLFVISLKAGMNQTVNGLAPFLLHTSNWQGLQVFFQGRPVRTDHGDSAHLVLKSLPI